MAANTQMMMLIQRMTSQMKIKSVLSDKIRRKGGGLVEREVVIENKSFRRHRGVRAKRGESIKKARPSYSSESDSNITPALRQITQRLNLGSDISSDESVANKFDSGQDGSDMNDLHISKSSDNTVVIRIGSDHTQHAPTKQLEGRNTTKWT